MRRASGGALILIAACELQAASFAFATDPSEHLNVQKPQRPDYLKSEPLDLPPAEPSPPDASGLGESERLTVKEIEFDGNKVISKEDLRHLTGCCIGPFVSVLQLEELRQSTTRCYINRGYATSGAISANYDPDTRIVTYRIVEGDLHSVTISGLGGLSEKYVRAQFPLEAFKPINIDELRERVQLLSDDPLFARVNAQLVPDAKLGQANLDIGLTRALPYQLTAFANNYRSPSVGSEAIGLRGWLANLTGQGDHLDASIQNSPDAGPLLSGSLGWQTPVLYSGTEVSVRVDRDTSGVVEEPLEDLNIRSVTDSLDFGVSQMLIERFRHKLKVGVNFVERRNETALLGEPFSFVAGVPSGIVNEHIWRIWQEYTYRSEKQVLGFRLTYSGVHNNVEEVSGLPVVSMPDRRYGIWLGQVLFAHRLTDDNAQVIVRGSAQLTPYSLLALDAMSIGGIYTVRGYRENQLVRDQGTVWNFEFDYPLFFRKAAIAVSLVPFYDYGYGKNKGEPGNTITSIGMAVRARWLGWHLDFAYGKRLVSPGFVDTSKSTLQDRGIFLELSYDFFRAGPT